MFVLASTINKENIKNGWRRVKGVVEDIQGKEADCHLDAQLQNMISSHHWTTAENNVIRGCDKLMP